MFLSPPTAAEEFTDVLKSLDNFNSEISILVKWWDWVVLETPDRIDGDQPLDFQLDILGNPESIKRWEQLQGKFVQYVELVRAPICIIHLTDGPIDSTVGD